MPISNQFLHNIEFTHLKGLRNLTVNFEPNRLTGIFGVNGSGKSTIIHALLAIYKPGHQDPARRDYIFSQFFTPTSQITWQGSSFKIDHTYSDHGQPPAKGTRVYSKAADRWNPRYTTRTERDVYFIGIDSCVPAIETEKKSSRINLLTTPLNDNISARIRQNLAFILNRPYDEYSSHANNKKTYSGLGYGGLSYSSLSMGAGEQRLIKILEVVFRAPRFSLIVIDEIDLTLHTGALSRLIGVLNDFANKLSLQIVFTSHREDLARRNDINVRHIFQSPNGTVCFNATNPDCISRLTGQPEKPIESFVEDKLGLAIFWHVAESLGVLRHCSVKIMGAAANAFPLAMSMHLKGEAMDHFGIFLDGDVYTTPQERLTQMERVYTGNDPGAGQRRLQALMCVHDFALPQGIPPEIFINNSLRALNDGSEIVNIAHGINGVQDKHHYVDHIIQTLGYPEEVGLAKIVQKFSETQEWQAFTDPIRNWLQARMAALNI